ncbi:hypothetical protein ABC766_29315 [Methylobacterium fujisawaense]|uniref:hypothetical protein n=1 Tax=Methylobacterium fujisawaense TaxID=107400 RepID=UPI0031F56984
MTVPHHWSETPANNGSSDPNADLRPGRPASTVLGAIRGLMATAALARDDNAGLLIASLGANNVYAVTTNEGMIDPQTGVNGIPVSITKPFTLAITFGAVPGAPLATTPARLVVDGFDCGPILRSDGSALTDGDIATGRVYRVLGDMAAATDTKVTRVRSLAMSPNEVTALAQAAIAAAVPALIATAVTGRVAKTGDAMSGKLTINGAPLEIGGGPSPYLDLVYGNVLRARQIIDASGNWILRNGDNGDNFIYVSPAGAIWTKQFGDLNSRIEARAASFADDRRNNSVVSMRFVYAGDLYNSWMIDAQFHSPFGGYGCIVDRTTFYENDGTWNIGLFRWRYLQMLIPYQGWVTVGAAS